MRIVCARCYFVALCDFYVYDRVSLVAVAQTETQTMSTIRVTHPALLCAIFAIFASIPIQAAPILLAELSYQVTRTDLDMVPDMMFPSNFPFVMTTFDPIVASSALWESHHSVADVGERFIASSDKVQEFDRIGLAPTTYLAMHIGAKPGPAGLLQEIVPPTGSDNDQTRGTFFVPLTNIGEFRITGLERTIVSLTVTPVDDNHYLLRAGQTVRIFGEFVPEPSAIGLSSLFAVQLALLRIRRFVDTIDGH